MKNNFNKYTYKQKCFLENLQKSKLSLKQLNKEKYHKSLAEKQKWSTPYSKMEDTQKDLGSPNFSLDNFSSICQQIYGI